jgi:hypothetical protein
MTKRNPPRAVSVQPADIERLADKLGISKETVAGREERERLQGWVPQMAAVVGAKQNDKFRRPALKEQRQRIEQFDMAAAAFVKELADGWLVAELELGAHVEWFARLGLDHTKLDDRVREINAEIAGTLYGISRMRDALADQKVVLDYLDDLKLRRPGNAAKPWVGFLTKACLDYHRQHLARLEPEVRDSALADAMLDLLNNSSGRKDQLARARRAQRDADA